MFKRGSGGQTSRFENWHVAAFGDTNYDRFVPASSGEIRVQPLAQLPSLHAHDVVDSGVVLRAPTEHRFPDVLLPDVTELIAERFLANVKQKLAEAGRFLETGSSGYLESQLPAGIVRKGRWRRDQFRWAYRLHGLP
jgi:hypothetical protein